jgi:hypothetical protein
VQVAAADPAGVDPHKGVSLAERRRLDLVDLEPARGVDTKALHVRSFQ